MTTVDIHQPPPLLLQGGRVLDLNQDPHRPGEADILIANGRIVSVGAPSPLAEPSGDAARSTTVIDARGKLVVPGFVNAHYHSHDVFLKGRFDPSILELGCSTRCRAHIHRAATRKSACEQFSVHWSAFAVALPPCRIC